jgi:hypothetical protein
MPVPLVALAGCFLTGCATNSFTEYYQSNIDQMPLATQAQLSPPSQNPRVITVPFDNYREEVGKLKEEGLICIGFSAFTGGSPTQQQLLDQANRVGADMVIFTSHYSHTVRGVTPLLSYHPEQTITTTDSETVTANAYGSGGYARGSGTYSGYSTTTTPGTLETNYVPYERRINEYGASFWRHTKPAIFGATLAPIPEEMRSVLQRNTGVIVRAVGPDGPAFRANILRGDVIIQVADKSVATVQDFNDIMLAYVGQTFPVKVIRGDKTLDVDVSLNKNP